MIIAVASCFRRCSSSRGGYSSVRNNSTRERDQEAQRNALIDELDEEWDD